MMITKLKNIISPLAESINNPTTDNKLTFVLTLALSGTGRNDQDLQRVRLLLETFDHFFDKRYLDQFLIVTRCKDVPEIRKVIGGWINSSKTTLLDQNNVCPEFRSDPDTINTWPKPNKGWFRQQLIKLAIHEHVRTPFYMTLDSDVLFVRNFNTHSVIRDGKAALNVQKEDDFRRLYCEETVVKEVKVRKVRYRQAEHILKCRRKRAYLGRWYGETPVLLNCQLVEALTNHIEDTWVKPWRQALLDNLPWTEYPLYFLYAEEQGLLKRYYEPRTADTVLRLTESFWHPADEYKIFRDLSTWVPDVTFGSSDEGIAIVVQSYLGYSVAGLAEMIRPYIK